MFVKEAMDVVDEVLENVRTAMDEVVRDDAEAALLSSLDAADQSSVRQYGKLILFEDAASIDSNIDGEKNDVSALPPLAHPRPDNHLPSPSHAYTCSRKWSCRSLLQRNEAAWGLSASSAARICVSSRSVDPSLAGWRMVCLTGVAWKQETNLSQMTFLVAGSRFTFHLESSLSIWPWIPATTSGLGH